MTPANDRFSSVGAFHGEATFEPTNPTHKKALSSVAGLWSLPLPDEWL